MSWSSQGYFEGRPETDYGNGDVEPDIDARNERVPCGITRLSVYYGCSSARFFRGAYDGNAREARAALKRIRMLTVYETKYGGVCRLADHLGHFVFLESRNGRTYFFDTHERPADWRRTVAGLLPADLQSVIDGAGDA